MNIRSATAEDIPALAKLATKTYVDAFGETLGPDELQKRITETRSEAYSQELLRKTLFLLQKKIAN